ncbi:MAG: rod shape-determining protein MreC [Verrucomicrobia bacterium]|nr:rod shape-determining protein MreC [Verrucomicrobiota bacterium]
MFKRPAYLLCAAAMLLAVVLLCVPTRASARLKLVLRGLFVPFFGIGTLVDTGADRASLALLPRRYLIEQHAKLQREHERMAASFSRLEELERENRMLREAMNWRQKSGGNLKLARVVGRDPANWWCMIHIDMGQRHGVQANYPVLTQEGLVGRVADAGEFQSRVIMIGDPNCQVSAWVVEAGTNTGMIQGGAGSGTDGSWADLVYLPNDPALKTGMRVVTSGMGQVFPRGIPIGRIMELRSVGHGLYLEAKVKLGLDLNALTEVFVLAP